MAAIAELMAGLAAMLAWPAPLRLRALTEADLAPLAALIVAVQCEYGFPWLGTADQQQQARESKAASLRHSLRLCAEQPEGNAFWVLEHTGGEGEKQLGAPVFRLVGCVGVRRAAEPANGTSWGGRPAELSTDSSTAELHALYLHPSVRVCARACVRVCVELRSLPRISSYKTLSVLVPHTTAAGEEARAALVRHGRGLREGLRLQRDMAGERGAVQGSKGAV